MRGNYLKILVGWRLFAHFCGEAILISRIVGYNASVFLPLRAFHRRLPFQSDLFDHVESMPVVHSPVKKRKKKWPPSSRKRGTFPLEKPSFLSVFSVRGIVRVHEFPALFNVVFLSVMGFRERKSSCPPPFSPVFPIFSIFPYFSPVIKGLSFVIQQDSKPCPALQQTFSVSRDLVVLIPFPIAPYFKNFWRLKPLAEVLARRIPARMAGWKYASTSTAWKRISECSETVPSVGCFSL